MSLQFQNLQEDLQSDTVINIVVVGYNIERGVLIVVNDVAVLSTMTII